MTDPNLTAGAPAPANSISVWSRLLSLWPKMATIFAIIGLIDVTKQLVEWAEAIHRIAAKYAEVREAVFALMPFDIPREWHNIVVLTTILFSVINAGYYQRTGAFYTARLINKMWNILNGNTSAYNLSYTVDDKGKRGVNIDKIMDKIGAIGSALCLTLGCIILVIYFTMYWKSYLTDTLPSGIFVWVRYGPDVMVILVLLSSFLAAGSLLAWRWIVVTALLFGGLFAINEIYVWAKPFLG